MQDCYVFLEVFWSLNTIRVTLYAFSIYNKRITLQNFCKDKKRQWNYIYSRNRALVWILSTEKINYTKLSMKYSIYMFFLSKKKNNQNPVSFEHSGMLGLQKGRAYKVTAAPADSSENIILFSNMKYKPWSFLLAESTLSTASSAISFLAEDMQ